MHTRLLTTVAASLMILAACTNNELPTGVDQSPGTDPSTSTVLDESSALAWHRAGHRATLVDAVETWNDDIEQFARLAFVSPPAEARISTIKGLIQQALRDAPKNTATKVVTPLKTALTK